MKVLLNTKMKQMRSIESGRRNVGGRKQLDEKWRKEELEHEIRLFQMLAQVSKPNVYPSQQHSLILNVHVSHYTTTYTPCIIRHTSNMDLQAHPHYVYHFCCCNNPYPVLHLGAYKFCDRYHKHVMQ